MSREKEVTFTSIDEFRTLFDDGYLVNYNSSPESDKKPAAETIQNHDLFVAY